MNHQCNGEHCVIQSRGEESGIELEAHLEDWSTELMDEESRSFKCIFRSAYIISERSRCHMHSV
jgi:hypothetical protein